MKLSTALIPFLVGIAPWTINASGRKLSKKTKSKKQGPPPNPNPDPPMQQGPPPNPNPDPPMPPSTFVFEPKDSVVELKITHTLNPCSTKADCAFLNDFTECIDGVCIWEETRSELYDEIVCPNNEMYEMYTDDDYDGFQATYDGSDESESSSFEISLVGTGSISGLSFIVPARSNTRIVADLKLNAMTSDTVRNLREGWLSLLDASRKEEFLETESNDSSLSANLGFLGFFSGGAKVEKTFSQSSSHMSSLGLSEEQINKAMDMFAKAASEMSSVSYDSQVFNQNNNRSVAGRLVFFTMGGTVRTNENKEKIEYMALSDGAAVGNPGNQAQADGGFVFS